MGKTSVEEKLPLGRTVWHHPRNLFYPAHVALSVNTIRHRHYGPVLCQWIGSCTGHSAAQALNTWPFHTARERYRTDDDAMQYYSLFTRKDPFVGEYPPEDTGSSGTGIGLGLKELGEISAFNWAFGIDHALQAGQLSPLLVGSNWYEGMFFPNSKGFIEPTGDLMGGHEWLWLRTNVRDRYITGLNSWGPVWGRKGLFRLSFGNLERLLHEQGDVLALIP